MSSASRGKSRRCDGIHRRMPIETIREKQAVNVPTFGLRERTEIVTGSHFTRPFGQWHRHDRPTYRLTRRLSRLTKKTTADPPPCAQIHSNPPVLNARAAVSFSKTLNAKKRPVGLSPKPKTAQEPVRNYVSARSRVEEENRHSSFPCTRIRKAHTVKGSCPRRDHRV